MEENRVIEQIKQLLQDTSSSDHLTPTQVLEVQSELLTVRGCSEYIQSYLSSWLFTLLKHRK